MTEPDLLKILQLPDATTNPENDILRVAPNLTFDEAYALQYELMNKRVSDGDRIIGYQASSTARQSTAKSGMPSLPVPMVGTLLASSVVESGATVPLNWAQFPSRSAEGEIGMLMAEDLTGPGVTSTRARKAVHGVFPAIELAARRPGVPEGKWSPQHVIATHNTGAKIIFGPQMSAPTLNLRLEGMVLMIDGQLFDRSVGTGIETIGDPFFALAEVANRIGRYGKRLEAGQIVITGACVLAPFEHGNRTARLECTRLGSVDIWAAPDDQ